MRYALATCLAGLSLLLTSHGWAGAVTSIPTASPGADSSSGIPTSFDFDVESTFLSGASFEHNSHGIGRISEQTNDAKFVISPSLSDQTLLRIGAFVHRSNLSLPANAMLPNTLQSAGLVVGADFQFDSIILRAEAQPGFYGDNHLTVRSFNVPFFVGGSYIVSPDLQWILGVSVDFNRPWVVIPAPGIRWRLGSQWVLNAVLPQPELEYEWSPSVTLHAGADLAGDTYRVSSNFGDTHGQPALNNALLTTEQVNLVVGATWQINQATLRMDAGYSTYRKYDFNRAETGFQNSDGSLFLGLSLEAKF
ncbi:MAG: hypothetical protein QM796_15985 [Chthoniobacteraceae bacterium]